MAEQNTMTDLMNAINALTLTIDNQNDKIEGLQNHIRELRSIIEEKDTFRMVIQCSKIVNLKDAINKDLESKKATIRSFKFDELKNTITLKATIDNSGTFSIIDVGYERDRNSGFSTSCFDIDESKAYYVKCHGDLCLGLQFKGRADTYLWSYYV